MTRPQASLVSLVAFISVAAGCAVRAQTAAPAGQGTGPELNLSLGDDFTRLAQVQPRPAPSQSTNEGPDNPIAAYFRSWYERVDQAQATQPHWMTPLVTVTPRLEQEYRYDQYWEHLGNGAEVNTFGSAKGLELIPTTTNELLLNPPPYQERSNVKPASSFGDTPFITVKQRFLSANEQEGNYIVTGFFGVQAPTGIEAFSNNAWVLTPTIAGGKGWGDFDVQATLGVPVPLQHQNTLGTQTTLNVALQYHIFKVFWPEFEMNLTHWWNGTQRGGKTQVFLTPGLVLGRFPIVGRLRTIIGAGYQFAVTPKLVKEPALTPVYDHAWILSARMAF